MSLAAATFLAGLVWGGGVEAQAPATPPQPAAPSMESLARDGFEIKAIQNASTRSMGYVVMMQRGAEVRACLMRITKGPDSRPSKQSVCF